MKSLLLYVLYLVIFWIAMIACVVIIGGRYNNINTDPELDGGFIDVETVQDSIQ